VEIVLNLLHQVIASVRQR